MGAYTKDFRNLLTILKNREEKFARVAAALVVRAVRLVHTVDNSQRICCTHFFERVCFRCRRRLASVVSIVMHVLLM